MTTPNRFSAAAESHVGVWGVGWLWRRWQERYVAPRTRIPYEYVRLLCYGEIRRLFAIETNIAADVSVAPVPLEDVQRMNRRRALLARAYNKLVASTLTAWIFRPIGPLFRVLGRKRVIAEDAVAVAQS